MCVKHDLTKETALSVTVCVKHDSSGRRSQLSMTTGEDGGAPAMPMITHRVKVCDWERACEHRPAVSRQDGTRGGAESVM